MSTTDKTTATIPVQVQLTHATRARMRACSAILDVRTTDLLTGLIVECCAKLGIPDPEALDQGDDLEGSETDREVI